MGEKKRRAAAGKLYMKETVTAVSNCLNCDTRMDMATNYQDQRPCDGAIAICIKCSHIMAYDAQLRLRELTDEEIVKIAGHPGMVNMVNTLALAKKSFELKYGKGTWVNRRKKDGNI